MLANFTSAVHTLMQLVILAEILILIIRVEQLREQFTPQYLLVGDVVDGQVVNTHLDPAYAARLMAYTDTSETPDDASPLEEYFQQGNEGRFSPDQVADWRAAAQRAYTLQQVFNKL